MGLCKKDISDLNNFQKKLRKECSSCQEEFLNAYKAWSPVRMKLEAEMKELQDGLRRLHASSRTFKLVGTGCAVVGASAMLAGTCLAPITGGGSLGVAIAAGSGLTGAGGITAIGAEVGEFILSKEKCRSIQNLLDQDKEQTEILLEALSSSFKRSRKLLKQLEHIQDLDAMKKFSSLYFEHPKSGAQIAKQVSKLDANLSSEQLRMLKCLSSDIATAIELARIVTTEYEVIVNIMVERFAGTTAMSTSTAGWLLFSAGKLTKGGILALSSLSLVVSLASLINMARKRRELPRMIREVDEASSTLHQETEAICNVHSRLRRAARPTTKLVFSLEKLSAKFRQLEQLTVKTSAKISTKVSRKRRSKSTSARVPAVKDH